MALVTTPKATNADSYASVAEADDYLANKRLNTTAWASLTTAVKEAALRQATEWLDANFRWFGVVRTEDQSLRWPRSGVVGEDGYFFDYDTYPQELVRATINLAYEFTQDNRWLSSADGSALFDQGFTEVQVGPIRAKLREKRNDPANVKPVVPEYIVTMLRELGTRAPGTRDSSTTKIRRT